MGVSGSSAPDSISALSEAGSSGSLGSTAAAGRLHALPQGVRLDDSEVEGVEFVEKAVLACPLPAKAWIELGRWNPVSLLLLAPAAVVSAAGPGPGPQEPLSYSYGAAGGAVVIGREDLLRVRASLGRVSDELHLILGVLDQHLEAPPVAFPPRTEAAGDAGPEGPEAAGPEEDFVPLPREPPSPRRCTATAAAAGATSHLVLPTAVLLELLH